MPHYIHPQKTSRIPHRFVFWDTEAVTTRHKGYEAQTWRLGVTCADTWSPEKGRWRESRWGFHRTPEALWEAVVAHAIPNARTVVVAHNLAYDLRIADAFRITAAMGWSVDKLTLSHGHIGFDLVKGQVRLIFVDSMTVLPASIEKLGKLVGQEKPALPGDEDGDDTWVVRCKADVEILRTAYLEGIDWLRKEDLGCWARTGAGLGWNTWTRRHLSEKVLCHEIGELHEIEASAMYTGRAEAWRHGRQTKGPFTEWDYELAYADVCASTSLPAVYFDTVNHPKLGWMASHSDRYRFLASATVSTELPVLPWRDKDGTFWPTGTFDGWWWDCELLAAERAGARITCSHAYRYRAAPFLAGWAQWATGIERGDGSSGQGVRALMAKHWTRAVVGRSAMQYRHWYESGPSLQGTINWMDSKDADSGARGVILDLGTATWQAWETSYSDQAVPQILSAVMAETRVRLWTAMLEAGLENVVYTDTDCLWVNPEGNRRIKAAKAAGKLWTLRRKGTQPWLDPYAPRFLLGSTYERIAGVPGKRIRLAELVYLGEVWEHLPTALKMGRPDEVRTSWVKQEMSQDDSRRIHLPGGRTEPYRVESGRRQELAEAV